MEQQGKVEGNDRSLEPSSCRSCRLKWLLLILSYLVADIYLLAVGFVLVRQGEILVEEHTLNGGAAERRRGVLRVDCRITFIIRRGFKCIYSVMLYAKPLNTPRTCKLASSV